VSGSVRGDWMWIVWIRLTRNSNKVAVGGRDRKANEHERMEPTVHYGSQRAAAKCATEKGGSGLKVTCSHRPFSHAPPLSDIHRFKDQRLTTGA
jgi:hypothetical protein